MKVQPLTFYQEFISLIFAVAELRQIVVCKINSSLMLFKSNLNNLDGYINNFLPFFAFS